MSKTLFTILMLLGLTICEIVTISQAQAQAQNIQAASKIDNDESQFSTKFGTKYNKKTNAALFAYRLNIYKQNKASINAHNSDKTKTYEVEINEFTDLTKEEFEAKHLGLKLSPNKVTLQGVQASFTVTPADWTNVTTPVKNQGSCGSCWAFSAVGVVQSAFKQAGQTTDLSEQELVDCAINTPYNNEGCNGGYMDTALDYIIKKKINSEAKYPYKAVDQTCKKITGTFTISKYVAGSGCAALASAIIKGPVSVAVDASKWSSYKTGVLNNCGTSLNHGVLLVAATTTYWKIKNSWGTSWGEKGFIRIKTGNTCGVCSQPISVRL